MVEIPACAVSGRGVALRMGALEAGFKVNKKTDEVRKPRRASQVQRHLLPQTFISRHVPL